MSVLQVRQLFWIGHTEHKRPNQNRHYYLQGDRQSGVVTFKCDNQNM